MLRFWFLLMIAIFLPSPISANISQAPSDKEIEQFAKSCGVQPEGKDEQKLNRFAKRAVSISRNWNHLDNLSLDADWALSKMVYLAANHFNRVGDTKSARSIVDEYEFSFSGYFASKMMSKSIGDHAPLSDWMAKWYRRLEAKFGPRFMETTRLKDLKTFNYAIPVVFSPKGEARSNPIIPWAKQDYVDHFVPFAGAVGYWTAWAGCTAGTWGLGWLTFICGSAGWAAEYIIMKEIAPELGADIWEKHNPSESNWHQLLHSFGF
jgi:hypothetical protein